MTHVLDFIRDFVIELKGPDTEGELFLTLDENDHTFSDLEGLLKDGDLSDSDILQADATVSLITDKGEVLGFVKNQETNEPSITVIDRDGKASEVFLLEFPIKGKIAKDFVEKRGGIEAFDIVLPMKDAMFSRSEDIPFYGLEDFNDGNDDNEARVSGGIDLTKPITLSTATSAKLGDGHWNTIDANVGQLIQALTTHTPRESKDGTCILQGKLMGTGRKAKSMLENYVLGVDLDTGETRDEVAERLAPTGLAYVLASTHSHMKSETLVLRDAVIRFLNVAGNHEITNEEMARFLATKRGIASRIADSADVVEQGVPTEEGTQVLVKHLPMCKWRVFFFLNEPFVFQGGAISNNERITEWKERYHGFALALDLVYDKAVVDPARLFYLPSCPLDSTEHESTFVQGDYLNLSNYERVSPREARRRLEGAEEATKPANAFLAASADFVENNTEVKFSDDLTTDTGLDLKRWIAMGSFDLLSALEHYAPDAVYEGEASSDGRGCHTVCAFEDEHTIAGGLGTFCVDASESDSGQFTIICTHNACSGRDRLEFIKGFRDSGVFPSDECLTDPRFYKLNEPNHTPVEASEAPTEANPQSSVVSSLMARLAKLKMHNVTEAVALMEEAAQYSRDTPEMKMFDNTFQRKFNVPKSMLAPKDTEEAKDETDAERERIFEEFNEKYAILLNGDQVKVLYESYKDNEVADYEKQYQTSRISLLSPENFRVKTAIHTVRTWSDREAKMVESEASQQWLKWKGRRSYNGISFAPGRQLDSFYNLFAGYNVNPSKEGSWDLMQEHIYNIVCNKDQKIFDWVLDWMADIVQNPAQKKGTAIAVRGAKGAGKTLAFEALEHILAPHSMKSAQQSHLIGKFNWHLADKLLLIAEEGFFAGSQQADSVFKDLITGTNQSYEKKGVDVVSMPNYTRFVVISNEDWVVKASLQGERRYLVLDAASDRIGDFEYFNTLMAQMKNGGYERMLYDLMHRDPEASGRSWSDLRKAPHTAALTEQAVTSLSPWDRFFVDMVERGGLPALYNYEQITFADGQHTYIPYDELRAHFRHAFDRARSSNTKDNNTIFHRNIEKYCKGKLVRTRQGHEMVKLPPLQDMRTHLVEEFQIKLHTFEQEGELNSFEEDIFQTEDEEDDFVPETTTRVRRSRDG